MITQEELTLKSLGELDGGKIGKLISNHLRRASGDCYDRPDDDRPRKVVIEICLTPVCEAGVAELVNTQIRATCKIPHHQSRPYQMQLIERGSGLLFNLGAPDSLDQHTMEFE